MVAARHLRMGESVMGESVMHKSDDDHHALSHSRRKCYCTESPRPVVCSVRARCDCKECFRCCRAPPPPLHGSASPAPPTLRARASSPATATGRLAASWTCAARTTTARHAGARAVRPASPLAIRCRTGITATCTTRRSLLTRWSRPRSSRPVACRSSPFAATRSTARCSPL